MQEKVGTKHNSAAGGSDDGTRLRWSGMDVFSVLMSRGYANTAARVETKSLYCLGFRGLGRGIFTPICKAWIG